jgi:hypothetical protein
MVPSTPNNRGQKFVPRGASFQNNASKQRPVSPGRQNGLPGKTEAVIGSFEGIIAREQSSRERSGHYHPSENNQSNSTGAPRLPRVYHAAPARPKTAPAAPLANSPQQPQKQGVNRVPQQDQKQAKKPVQARQNGGNRRSGGRGFRNPEPQFMKKREGGNVPAIDPRMLRIIPLGGQEEVGRNMTVFEYGDDIVIIDMGMQFPEEDMPGIDYIVPNVDYLKGKEHKIRGVLFTHGHLDHIGAAPILLKQLKYPTVIRTRFHAGASPTKSGGSR